MTRELPAEQDTAAFGHALSAILHAGMTVWLRGELGAGKTTLVRAILRGMGVTGPIKSPTYTLVEPYNISSLYLYHFDFYRFENPDEWIDAGFRDCFGGTAICLVEWPDRAAPHLPSADLVATLTMCQEGRELRLSAHTPAGTACLRTLQDQSAKG